MKQKALMKYHYQRIFGETNPMVKPTPVEPPKPDPIRAMMNKIFGNNGMHS